MLTAGQPAAADELPRLTELFDTAFPTADARKQARAWAGEFRRRREAEFASFRRVFGDRKHASPSSDELRNKAYAGFARVLPPDGPWADARIAYQYVGLTEASRAAARDRWLSFFPESQHDRVRAMGERVAAERRAAGEPLPDVPDVVPLVCAVERIAGGDPYGRRCRDALDGALGPDAYALARTAAVVLYPGDDFYFLGAGPDPFRLHPMASPEGGWTVRFARLIAGAVILFISAAGFRAVLTWFVVPLVMTRSARPRWDAHLAGRGSEPFLPWLAGALLATVAGAAAARATLPEAVSVQLGSPAELLLGAFMVATLGGLLVATCRRLLAVALTVAGVDVERTWLDEVFGVALGAFVLVHFGNDWVNVAIAALTDVAAGAIHVAAHRPGAPAATSANFQAVG